MTKSDGSEKQSPQKIKQVIGRLINSKFVEKIANAPLIGWTIRKITALLIRLARVNSVSPKHVITDRESKLDLETSLKHIAQDIVEASGYTGAMIATYEQGDALPARAVYVNPDIATIEQIEKWGEDISEFTEAPVSITDPNIAKVYIHDEFYKDNLSVRAAKAGNPIRSNSLYDLFTPIAPPASKNVVNGIQDALDVKEVIAVPFFLNVNVDGDIRREYIGNLFAIKKEEITKENETDLLKYARQAASTILSERRRLSADLIQNLILEIQRNLANEDLILLKIAQGVVDNLGYSGAMVATYEEGDALPARALYVDPQIASSEKIKEWEELVSQFSDSKHPVSITNPDVARVYIHQDEYENNLSVKAAKAGKPIISNSLFDLFTPIAPNASKNAVNGIQDALRIKQVIAVPFFFEDEYYGNLFAATQSGKFNIWEIELLQAFGEQAAVGIKNAKLFKRSEDRRLAAEILGRMAFSAVTAVHEFRNHLAVVRGNLQLFQVSENNPNMLRDQISKIPTVMKRLDRMADILGQLHQPWSLSQDIPIDINACINHALGKVIPEPGDWVKIDLANNLPKVSTSQDMLTEAFKVLIKNANEAITEKGSDRLLMIQSRILTNSIEVTIRDNGIGIKKENLSRVFDMRWTTKSTGLGFGLFWTKDYIEGLEPVMHF